MKQETQGSGAEMKACQLQGAALHGDMRCMSIMDRGILPSSSKRGKDGRELAARQACSARGKSAATAVSVQVAAVTRSA